MKKNYLRSGLAILLGFLSLNSSAQFSGAFDPLNWTLTSVGPNSDANVNTSGAPASITFTGNNSSAGDPGTLFDTYSDTIPCGDNGSGNISFDYNFTDIDIENFYYVVNGVETFVTGTTSTGTLSIAVTAGGTFGFRIYSYDDCCGAGVLIISNFAYSDVDLTAPVPDILTLADATGDCSMTPLTPEATDNCSGLIVASTTATFPITAIGTTVITWTYIDGAGNISTQDQNVIVSNPLILTSTVVDETIGNDGSIDLTITGNSGAVTIDWDNDGTGDNDDTEDLSGLAAGTYTVVVTDAAGCSTTLAVDVNSQVGISENNLQFSVYPNPSNSLIQATSVSNDIQAIHLTNSLGQVVSVYKFTGSNLAIDISDFDNGVYFIQFVNQNGVVHTEKISKI